MVESWIKKRPPQCGSLAVTTPRMKIGRAADARSTESESTCAALVRTPVSSVCDAQTLEEKHCVVIRRVQTGFSLDVNVGTQVGFQAIYKLKVFRVAKSRL